MHRFSPIILAFILATSIGLAQEPATPIKIGVFDSKRLVLEHWKYPGVMASLREEKDRLDVMYRKKAATVQGFGKERDAIVKALKSPVLSPDAKRDKETELKNVQRDGAAALKELRSMEKDFYRRMMDKEKDERRILTKDILAEIEDFGKKNGFTLIIDKAQGIAFAADALMITDQLLKRINAGHETPKPEVNEKAPEKAPEK